MVDMLYASSQKAGYEDLTIVDYEKLTEGNHIQACVGNGICWKSLQVRSFEHIYIKKYSGSKDNDVGGKN